MSKPKPGTASFQKENSKENKGAFSSDVGKMKELGEAFKKAQEVQAGAEQLRAELERMEVEGESRNGLVKVVLNAVLSPQRVFVSPEALGEGAEVVSDLVMEAMKEAHTKSAATMRGKVEELTGGVTLPRF